MDRGDLAPDAYDERDGAARATSALRRRVGCGPGSPTQVPSRLAGFIANSANVVVTVLLARLLSTRGYGALAQLTSLFLIVSVPGTAVVVGVVRRVTALATSGRGASVRDWAHRNHMRVTVAVAVLAIAVFSARGPIAHMLSIPTPLGVFAMVVAGSVWVLLSLDRGLLQAKRRYRVLSVNLLVEGERAPRQSSVWLVRAWAWPVPPGVPVRGGRYRAAPAPGGRSVVGTGPGGARFASRDGQGEVDASEQGAVVGRAPRRDP